MAKEVNRLVEKYNTVVVPAIMKAKGYTNVYQVPKIEKIVVNRGLGDCKDNAQSFNKAVDELAVITGQKPIVTTAKKSIANFKLRQGNKIGAKVTLRGTKMYEFLDRVISIALPRVRDFQGISDKAFDGRGNYALGLKEQLVFPEISYDKIDKIRGLDIVIVTTAKNDEDAKLLLEYMGLPFRKR
ncbi:MAG: 50S ribosomal protein L5 [Clostridiales bacterium]|nr:50S ribosomal protein L5 [Clostridiales bacterium]